MKREIWKPIKNYENLYDASNYGRIRSLDRYEVVGKAKRFRKGRIMKPYEFKGYLRVALYKDGKMKVFQIHRLVWEAFNGEIPEGIQVNHIDENPLNNRLDNLNLMTCKENINYGTAIKRRSEKRSKALLQLTYPGLELICEWSSVAEAGRNGFTESHVSRCCNGKQKTHKGVTFRYKETYSIE